MRRYLLDANLVLRFLLNDHPELSDRAAGLFARAAAGECVLVLPSVVVAECVCVLRSFYDKSHADISRVLSSLATRRGLLSDEPALVVDALDRMARTRLDYVDCYLAARAADADDTVATFDKGLRKFDDIRLWANE